MKIILPPVSDDQISCDLRWLTELLITNGIAEYYAGGILGGEYGYGVEYENDTFQMHPFCWCGRPDCPWCRSCECPEDAVRYLVNGVAVDFNTYWERPDEPRRTEIVPDLECANCRDPQRRAANFLHKPSGSRVSWYKYIGRDMEVDLHASWRPILDDCARSAGAS